MVDLSVLVTCYNKEAYLDDCITSLLRQTKEPKEIIIVHDKCDEPKAHAAADTFILKNNLGVSRARHEAFRISTGKLILFLDGDDLISPDYLEKMILVLFKGADIVYPDIYHWAINAKLNILPKVIDAKFVKKTDKIPIPVTSLMRREVYETLGGFRDFPALEDFDFWLRAMVNGYTFRKAETLFWYRATPDGRNAVDAGKIKKTQLEIFNQFEFVDGKLRWKNGKQK